MTRVREPETESMADHVQRLGAETGTGATASDPEASTVEILGVLWTGRRVWLVTAALGLLAGAGVSLLLPTIYRASTSVVASAQIESSSGVGGMASIAGAARQLGIPVGGAGSDPSSLFVPILRSRRMAEEILAKEFTFSDGEGRTLADHLVGDLDPGPARDEAAVKAFRKDVLRTGLSLESGVLTISALLDDPQVAAEVAAVCARTLDEFNREAKSAQAARWVEFIEGRLAEAETELTAAEDRLKTFREQNRAIADSPSLLLEEGRHMREVAIAQEIFTTVKTQHELAKVEQMKNVPVLAVLDPATVPVERFRPRRSLVAAAGLLIGGFLGIAFLLGRRALATLRRHEAFAA